MHENLLTGLQEPAESGADSHMIHVNIKLLICAALKADEGV